MNDHWPENATEQQKTFVHSDTVSDQARLRVQFFFQSKKYLFDLFIRSQRTDICVLQRNIVAQFEDRKKPVESQPVRWTKSIDLSFKD